MSETKNPTLPAVAQIMEIVHQNDAMLRHALQPIHASKLPTVAPPPIHRNPAESMRKRLLTQIVEFQKELDADHEVGLSLVETGSRTVIHVEDVGYHGTDMVIFYGRDMNGNRVRVLQHYSRTLVTLTALPKLDEKPIRILGFLGAG